MFKEAVLNSLKWAAIGRFSSQIVTWAITIVVIRLLSPGDYGTMAFATMIVSFFAVFEELGLSAALVNTRRLSTPVICKIFGIVIVAAVVLYGIIWTVAPLAESFFDAEQLANVIRVLALSVPLAAFGAIPLALLQRDMRFRDKSVADFIAAITSSVATLILAMTGFGVWSLVAGSVALAGIRTAGYWVALGKLYLPNLNFRGVGSELQFGGMISIDRLLYIFYSQADTFFIGKFLGKEVLGVYSVAMQLASLPMRKIVGILNEVGFSAFSKIQEDSADVSQKLLHAVRSLSMIAFPVFVGISVVSTEIVNLFLGEKWLGVTVPLALLSLTVPLRLVNSTTATMLHGIGRADVAAGNSLAAFLFFIPAFAATAILGDLTAVCLAWVVAYPVYHLFCLTRALPKIGLRRATYYSAMRRSVVSAATMAATVYIFSLAVGDILTSEILLLAAKILVGAVSFAAMTWIFARDEVDTLLRLLKA